MNQPLTPTAHTPANAPTGLRASLEAISNFFFATKKRTNLTVLLLFAALISAKVTEALIIPSACGV